MQDLLCESLQLREKSRQETGTAVIGVKTALSVTGLDQIRNGRGGDEDGEFSPAQGQTQEPAVHELEVWARKSDADCEIRVGV